MRSDSRRSDRSGTALAISVKRMPAAVQQHVEDRARPALADQLDRLVVARAAARRTRCAGVAIAASVVGARSFMRLRGAQHPRLLDRAVHRDVAGDVDHRREGLHGQHRDRLEELLVAPARLARLLVEVLRELRALGRAAAAGSAAARPRAASPSPTRLARATSSMPRPAWRRRAGVQLRDPARSRSARPPRARSARRVQRQRAVAQLRAEARVARSAAGEPASTPRKFGSCPAADDAPLRIGQRRLGRRQVVVDREPAHLCLGHGHHRGEELGGARRRLRE